MYSLAKDESIVIKHTNKGSSVVVLDREGYLVKDTLIDKKTYIDVNNFSGKILCGLTDKSDKIVNYIIKSLYQRKS